MFDRMSPSKAGDDNDGMDPAQKPLSERIGGFIGDSGFVPASSQEVLKPLHERAENIGESMSAAESSEHPRHLSYKRQEAVQSGDDSVRSRRRTDDSAGRTIPEAPAITSEDLTDILSCPLCDCSQTS